MSEKKIIAIVGATGAQGGGLARAILNDPNSEFSVRALTRNPGSPAAQELAKFGAEVVVADLGDAESLKKAFAGAYGAYCVTFFWDHLSAEREGAEAKAMAEAAKAAGVQHVIWSTLEDTRKWVPLDDDRMPTLMGKYKVPHFDGKGESDHWFTDLGVPTTFLLTSFYWDNFVAFGMGPKADATNTITLNLPMGGAKLAGISAEDIGRCAYGVFKRGKDLIGKRVGIASDHLTGEEIAKTLSKVLGKSIAYNPIPWDVYRGLGFPGADDLGNMFQVYHDFADEFSSYRTVSGTRELNPQLQSFEQWAEANKAALLSALG